jgi:predicted nucleotidyltransferase
MKIIAKYLGGSHSYGLANADSDRDERFLFLNTKISDILGLSRHDHQNTLNSKDDIQGFELRHFLNLLRRGNTQCLEMLNNSVWLEKTSAFDIIQSNKNRLLHSETIYKCFKGYSYSERNLIFGRAHLGRIGEKRAKAIEQHGYSFRNASHCFRLLRTAILFFKTNEFIVNIVETDKEYGELMKDIKFHPENHKPEQIELQLIELEKDLDEAYSNRNMAFNFDVDFANELCYRLYMPILNQKL